MVEKRCIGNEWVKDYFSLWALYIFTDSSTFVALEIIRTDNVSRLWELQISKEEYKASTNSQPFLIYQEDSGKYYIKEEFPYFCQNDFVDAIGKSPLSKTYEQAFPAITKFPFKNSVMSVEFQVNANSTIKPILR